MFKRDKRAYIKTVLFIIIILTIFGVVYFDVIKESIISGFQTATFEVLISVNTHPKIFIIHPTNTTYSITSIDLNFTIEDDGTIDRIWYRLDSGENTTITQNITLSVLNLGGHTVTLYANDTNGAINSSSVAFTTEAAPTVVPGGGGSAGGGIGGVSRQAVSTSFLVDKDEIKVKLKQGETKREQLAVTNILDRAINIQIDSGELRRFIFIQEEFFTLQPGETKNINLDIVAPEVTEPDIYLGKIIISDGSLQKLIFAVIEIEDKNALFDVKIDIPNYYRRIYPGGELLATVSIFSIERVGLVDTEIEYIVKDDEGNDVYSEKETLAVDVQTSFVKSLKVPTGIEPGNYVLYIKVTYDGIVSSASSFFEIIELQVPKRGIEIKPIYILYLSIFIAIIYIATKMLKILSKGKKKRKHSRVRKLKRIKRKKRK